MVKTCIILPSFSVHIYGDVAQLFPYNTIMYTSYCMHDRVHKYKSCDAELCVCVCV